MDISDKIITFTSSDTSDPLVFKELEVLQSKETHANYMYKNSLMYNDARYVNSKIDSLITACSINLDRFYNKSIELGLTPSEKSLHAIAEALVEKVSSGV